MIRLGDCVIFEGREYLVCNSFRADEARLECLETGEYARVDRDTLNKLEKTETKPKYVLVGQTNWEEKRVDSKGRKYTSLGHKAPKTLEEAKDMAQVSSQVFFSWRHETRWGHGTYAIQPDGSVQLASANWDSSG